ncbi:MAG: zinc-ribbon domain-containing protein [Promethearchaeota archaeon]|jgi:predicted RNA-binding Zn-ribbon protein involved in translation (DUF1610 family)
MVDQDYSQLFSCPKCGMIGSIFFLKVVGNKVIIKQRCPKHGGRSFKVPLMEKENYNHLIRDRIFRCNKCGQEAIVNFLKLSGPWTLIKCSCPTHGTMPIQKIWSSMYTEISTKGVMEQQPPQAQPVETDEKMFCSSCGAAIKSTEKFCGNCGVEIE